jgi:hypothetical protein
MRLDSSLRSGPLQQIAAIPDLVALSASHSWSGEGRVSERLQQRRVALLNMERALLAVKHQVGRPSDEGDCLSVASEDRGVLEAPDPELNRQVRVRHRNRYT